MLVQFAAAPDARAPAFVSEQSEKAEILLVIANMQAAWNRNDFRGYMEGFANPDVVFVFCGLGQRR